MVHKRANGPLLIVSYVFPYIFKCFTVSVFVGFYYISKFSRSCSKEVLLCACMIRVRRFENLSQADAPKKRLGRNGASFMFPTLSTSDFIR